MDHNYRVSLKIGESSYEIESTDLKWLESKEEEYLQKLSYEAPKYSNEDTAKTSHTRVAALSPEMTLQEYYRKYIKNIKSRPSIAVFFVYYLQKMKKKDKIATSDVQNCFKSISYPNWNKLNVTDILNSSKRRALVNYVNKLWSLTTTGEDYILNIMTGKTK